MDLEQNCTTQCPPWCAILLALGLLDLYLTRFGLAPDLSARRLSSRRVQGILAGQKFPEMVVGEKKRLGDERMF